MSDRIGAALRESSSADLGALAAEARAEITKLVGEADRLDAVASDPRQSDAEADKARRAAADVEHKLRRLRSGHDELAKAIALDREREAEKARADAYAAAAVERDEIAAEIAREYPAICERLLDLMAKMEASDARVAEVNQRRPQGVGRLRRAEEVAREVEHLPNCGFPPGDGGSVAWTMPLAVCVRLPRLSVREQMTDGYLHGSAVRL